VCIPHGSISKLHAFVHREGEGWALEDRESTNGTWVDGVRVPALERRPLSDGGQVRLGEAIRARFFEPETFYRFCVLNRAGP